MTAQEKRLAVRAAYEEILGRNDYSQRLRDYCYRKYTDGKYYSDCSSSVSHAYQKALGKENSFGILNTVGMYNSKKMVDVPVEISKGQIMNPEVMEIGDMLLYAGTDNSRPGCVGHVEMYAGIIGGKHCLYGHGSGKPKKVDMVEKNKSRYNSKTSTKVGNKGLIRVRRFIVGDDIGGGAEDKGTVDTGVRLAAGSWFLRTGPGKEYDAVGTVGDRSAVEIVARLVGIDGWLFVKIGDKIGFISANAVEGV